MTSKQAYTIRVALIVALGGFLMGFDASVISGVVKFIEPEFQLTKLQLGFSVASLTLTATLAMMISGPLADKYGRKKILALAAILFTISAIGSALAPTFNFLVIARMLGGFGVGAALIIAPMYIAEIAPPKMRGQMVSFNQLNIVIGISMAFFTNYLILMWGQSDLEWAMALKMGEYNWRWMLGLETLPAILYFFGLFSVPESPRWQIMKGQDEVALATLNKVVSAEEAQKQLDDVKASIKTDRDGSVSKPSFGERWAEIRSLIKPMRLQSGIGTDASFIQAILVGLTNLVFTVLAILFIDRLGRKPLLIVGMAGIALMMFLLAYGFGSATYTLQEENFSELPDGVNTELLAPLVGKTFDDDVSYKIAIREALGRENAGLYESQLITAAITMNSTIILIGILGFVASFAVSIGPVMWVLFSELFPLQVKGIAISLVGFINSAVSYIVQQIFPWELDTFGSSTTFLIYGLFGALGFVFVLFVVPETKGKTLEELEKQLVK
jgi:MFS family permease